LNLFIRKNNLFGIVFTDQAFSIENQSYGRLKEKLILKEFLFNQISTELAYSWPAIAAHAKFEQYMIGLDLQIFTKIEMILSRFYPLIYFQSNCTLKEYFSV
jgi:hypothetical protein